MMISGIFHKAWRPLSLLAGLRWKIRSRCFTPVSAQSRPVAKTQLSSPEEHLRRLSLTLSRRWTLQFFISAGHFEYACSLRVLELPPTTHPDVHLRRTGHCWA